MSKAEVRNAADETQVAKAGKAEEEKRRQELNDIRTVLSTISGRRLLWRMMEQCKTFSSVMDNSAAKVTYNAGKQDLGHFIMAEIVEADENLLFKMMKEQKNGEKE